ncbi:MAG TPA: hypothetical protein VIU61_23560 [Kofleriaceae bacterium]
MRVASIVLLVLTVETAFAESVPDHETQMLASNARQLARLGRCDMALEVGEEVAQRDAAYYHQTVAADAGLFACVSEINAERRYRSWRDNQPPRPVTHRFGVDAMQSIGLFVTQSGWLRYEHAKMGLVVRLGGARGAPLEGPERDAVVAHVGIRSYIGGFFLYAEAGAAAVYKQRWTQFDETEPAEWSAIPSFAAGLGGKIGRFEIGLSALFPALGVGLHVGFDFLRR